MSNVRNTTTTTSTNAVSVTLLLKCTTFLVHKTGFIVLNLKNLINYFPEDKNSTSRKQPFADVLQN